MVRLAQSLTSHRAFQATVVVFILLAGSLAGLETFPAVVAEHGNLLGWLDRLVLAVFTAELLLKLVAGGRRWTRYFTDGWNVFDAFIVLACYLPVGGPFAAVLRLTRVLRLLRLVHALPKLQLLVGALLKSLSSMGYVSLLLGLMFYIYAVAGVHLFRDSDPADFGTLPTALLTLFRIVTLDNWGDAFTRATEVASPWVVSAYFISFIVLGTMIILNLFIGIVMNSMAEMHRELEADAAEDRPAAALTDGLRAIEQQLAGLQLQVRSVRDEVERSIGTTPPARVQGRPMPQT